MRPTAPVELGELRRALSESGIELELAVLFGSLARGNARPDSDLDMAILPYDRDLSLASELVLEGELAFVSGRNVDLVRLDTASTLLAFQIAKNGLLLVGEERAFARFQARAALAYADYAPVAEAAALRSVRAALSADTTS